jgi:hypothetical protein
MKMNKTKILLTLLILLLTGCKQEDVLIVKNDQIGINNFILGSKFDMDINNKNIQSIQDGYITYLIHGKDSSRTFIKIPFESIMDGNKSVIRKILYSKSTKCNNIVKQEYQKFTDNAKVFSENNMITLSAGDESLLYNNYYLEMSCDTNKNILTVNISADREFSSSQKMKFNKFLENKIINESK